MIGFQIARDVDVTLLQQQLLRRRLRDMANQHPLHGGGAVPVVVVANQGKGGAGFPGLQREGAGSGIVGAQPGKAQVPVDFILHDQFFIHHRTDGGGQAVENEGGGERLFQFHHQGAVINRADPVRDVFGGETELGKNESGGFIQ